MSVRKPTVRVRTARVGDAEAIQAIYAPVVRETAISFEDVAPTPEEMADRIGATLRAFPYLVAEDASRVVGYAYAGPFARRAAYRQSVETSAYVAEDARGRGVGRALYEALLTTLTDRGFHMAFAGIALPNPSSVGLHEAVGFEAVGVYREAGFKFGRWHDVGWWQRRLSDRTPEASEGS